MARRASRSRRRRTAVSPVWRRLGLTVGAAVFAALAAIQVPGSGVKLPSVLPNKPEVATAPAPSPASTGNFALCPQHSPGFVPTVARPGQQRALCFEGFAVLHSGESKTPIYSVQRMTAESVAAAYNRERPSRFFANARLPSAERAQLADYDGSGYIKGYMTPAADMATDTAKAQ
jgi:endonuclease G